MSDSNQSQPSNCRACDSADVFGPLRLYPESGMGEANILVATARTRPLFGRHNTTALTAWACRTCGHLELFAADPEALFEHWSVENP